MAAKKRSSKKRTSKKRSARRAPATSRHSEEKIAEALAAWLRTGSSRAAAKATRINASTIRNWRERRPELWARVCREHEEQLSGLRASIAATTAEGLRLGAAEIWRQLKEAEAGALTPKDLSALVRTLSEIDSTQDRIRRLDLNRPTEIVESRTDEEAVAALRRGLEELGFAPEVIDGMVGGG